jgi:endonuclease/exonuclease/phosphatase (EEP) superfamily protein YafD
MSLAEGNSSGAAPAKRSGPLTILLRGILVLLVLALIGVSVGAALTPWVPAFVLLTPFAPQVAVVALISAVLGFLLGMRRLALIPAALALWQGALVMPFIWPAPVAATSGEPLRVVSLNLWPLNQTPEQTVAYLQQSGADVIATVETGREWRERLEVLHAAYPYRADCGLTQYLCGVAIMSKLPFQSTFIGPAQPGEIPVLVAVKVEWNGKPLTIAAVQVHNPRIGLRSGFQAKQGDAVTSYFAGVQGDAVLMGDFNSVPWGPLQRELRAETAFDNRGRLAFTWPSWAPAIFRIPIDQIFTAGALAVRNYRAGPPVGSDHLAVTADIYRTAP